MQQVIAIIWQRFGPYHHARLEGASDVFVRHGYACEGIEIASQDHYAWHTAKGRNTTLFPDSRYESLSRRQIHRAVQDYLKHLDPAAVAVNGWSVPEALAATAWCVREGRPVILMSETHESSGRWWKELLKRRRVRRCQAALVGGRWHADYLASLGFPRSKIVRGYDAVDNDYFDAGANQARAAAAQHRSQFALPERYFYANTRFLPRKNIDGLLQAYASYRNKVPQLATNLPEPWQLVISGTGEMEQPWKSQAASLGVSDTVHWPGFVQYEQLPVYYGLASAFIHPARREAWGLVVNEAAAAGLPLIVGNRVGAACELVEDGENGYLVNADIVDQLSERMLRVSALDEPRRAAMGQRSRRLVAKFAPEQFGNALWSALQCALTTKVCG